MGRDESQKIFDEGKYEWDVFSAVLYFASDKGKQTIPSPWVTCALFSELITAVLEYLGEKWVFESFNKLHDSLEPWEYKSNKILEKAFCDHPVKMNPALARALSEGLELHFVIDHGDKGFSSSFLTFLDILPSIAFESTYNLFPDWIEKTKKEIFSHLDPDTLKHCEAIGILMREHIKRDVEYVKKTYRW